VAKKIQKWGNSLGVRIPKAFIEKLQLEENTEVVIDVKNGSLVITPALREYSLDSLVDKITKNNLHREEDFASEGNEVW
jgi:antitoxin MazE